MIHSLDILEQFFEEIYFDIKLFEVRKDKPNRIFSIGDFILLREVNESPFEHIYTGRSLYVQITYISSYIPNYKVLQIKKMK